MAHVPSSAPDEAPGGDPVCWLHLLCPACGRVADGRGSSCPSCGAALGDGG